MDTSTSGGNLIFQVFGALAEFERNIIRDRTNAGLDGLCFGVAARWPEALHLGNGAAVPYFDERANQAQRDALMQILTGRERVPLKS